MGILRKAFGLETLAASPGAAGYASDVTPPARSTVGPPLTVDRALSLTSVFRAVQLIAGMGAQLQLNSWRGTQMVDPAPSLVRAPDPWRPRSSFLERFLVNAATDGNNFLLKAKDPYGRVTGVEALNPFQTFVRWEKGVKYYDTTARNGRPISYTDADVLHVPGLEVPGYDRGLGPIGACRLALASHLDVRDYAAEWFGPDARNDVPSGVLSTDQRLDPGAAGEYKRMWLYPEDTVDRDGRPVRSSGPSVRVLGQGLTYAPIMLKPSDAQWLESQAFGVLDIARLFGMPAEYLEAAVDGSSLVYSSLPMLDTRFLKTTLFPVYLRKLEAALTDLLPHGQEARFDATELLRPDPKVQAEIDAVYMPLGVYDADYVRGRIGIPGPAPTKPANEPAPAPAPQEVPQ